MPDQTTSSVLSKMQKSLEVTRADLATIRTGRATPALVENIIIAAYGGNAQMKIREMATISSSDSMTLTVQPFDPATKDDIVKGILEANTGLNPVVDGEQIRISIPPLSEERRQEYLKLAKAKLEAGKVMIRQVRHEEMGRLKRSLEAKEITEDDRTRQEKHLQELTDEMITEVDRLGELKEKELLQI